MEVQLMSLSQPKELGNPLTQFLFIVAAKGLVGIIRQAKSLKMLNGMKIGRR